MYVKFTNDKGNWMVPFTNITGFLAYYSAEASFGGRNQIYGMLYGVDQSYEIHSIKQLDRVREQLELEWAVAKTDEAPPPPPPPPPPLFPMGYSLIEGDFGPYCPKCRSSLKSKWYWWFPFCTFRTDKCVHDECENYYDRLDVEISNLKERGKKIKADCRKLIDEQDKK